MIKKDFGLHIAGLLALGLSTTTQATLIDRGNGMIYDSDQDLTWLQDANYAKTSGHLPGRWKGNMLWEDASAWADGLVYGGFDDWRLPTVTASEYSYGFNGQVAGYNVDTTTSELAYMFHVILGNESSYKSDGTKNDDGCPIVTDDSSFFAYPKAKCLVNTSADGVEFRNIQWGSYAAGTNAFDTQLDAWFFDTGWGAQETITKSDPFYAWAVRKGDVGAPDVSVPEPGTLMLMLAGLAGIGVTMRRRR
jgi:hypothetical protein